MTEDVIFPIPIPQNETIQESNADTGTKNPSLAAYQTNHCDMSMWQTSFRITNEEIFSRESHEVLTLKNKIKKFLARKIGTNSTNQLENC